MRFLPNGAGATVGGSLVTARPLYLFAGNVWYVSSTTGVDGAGLGKDRERPLATLAQAQTNASAGDIVVLMNGHTETLAARLVISKTLYICGEGSSGGLPTVSYRSSSTADNIFNITATNVELDNILFLESSSGNTGNDTLVTGQGGGKVYIQAADCRITNCYFQEGSKDLLSGVIAYGAAGAAIDRFELTATTFISTATQFYPPSGTVRPTFAIRIPAGSNDMVWEGAVFSDGTVGFSTCAVEAVGAASVRARLRNVSLLLGASARFHASSTGWLHVGTSTGGAMVEA